MSYKWFKKLGWIYRPVSVMGWLLTLITTAMCVWFFIVIDRHSHSGSDTLINLFPFAALFVIICG